MVAIAIDGPAGAGKSTIAKQLAKDLEYIYVDTGALYRTVGLSLSQNSIDLDVLADVEKHLESITVDIKYINGEQRVFLCGIDVSDKIRTPEISMMASKCSALPIVRAFLLSLQRDLAKKNNVIMDGRDIGTVVLPDAKVKIFLTADPEERARRRYVELIEKGQNVKYEDVLADLKERDYADSHRAVAPLKPAEDSVTINTTGKNLEESVELLKETVNKLLGE